MGLVFRTDNGLVIFGGGHAATVAVRAAKKGLVKSSAIAAVAPTWAGPLPIVFGKDSNMETRYSYLKPVLSLLYLIGSLLMYDSFSVFAVLVFKSSLLFSIH